jgi:hypothetical protein
VTGWGLYLCYGIGPNLTGYGRYVGEGTDGGSHWDCLSSGSLAAGMLARLGARC